MSLKLRFFIVFLFTIMAMPILGCTRAYATNPADFNPGRIIDDEVFYNKDAMSSVAEVQNFINNHTPACDTWGTQPSGYGNLTRSQYNQQIKGWAAPPYVCLQNYYENPTTGETSFEKGGGSFSGGESAAQIIYDAAQQYTINPEVLLITIRKESLNLFSDDSPLKSQYKYAMGYACPDSGPNYSASCVESKSGFYKQVTLAAWQLRHYYENMGSYNYAPGRTNTIQYSTSPSCGTRDVYIENYATASLYIYTPYTPSVASLNAYPGETSSCGSYGNRNFWYMWQEWFGSPYGTIKATPLTVSASDDLGQRFVGDKITVSFTVKNLGSRPYTFKNIGIAGRDATWQSVAAIFYENFTLQAGESRVVSGDVTLPTEGEYRFFVSSIGQGESDWKECFINQSQGTCYNPYVIQAKPEKHFQYTNQGFVIRKSDKLGVSYTVTNPSQIYSLKDSISKITLWVDGNARGQWVDNTGVIAPNGTATKTLSFGIPNDSRSLVNYQIFNAADEVVLPLVTVKSDITLTQGLSLSTASPRALDDVIGSFKVKNNSQVAITKNEQLCYIIRDIPDTGAQDFGCLSIGTVQPGQELEFSRVGHFSHPGNYKAWFAIYDGSRWRPYDTYMPETGAENTTLNFTVKPAL